MELFVVLVLSIITLLSLLVGTLIVFSTKNNDRVMTFSVSLGFIVLVLLGVFHLISESYEHFLNVSSSAASIIYLICFTLIGFGVVIALDVLGGHHEHKSKNKKFKHISIITCAFLLVHNFIEGMTLYSTVLVSLEAAVILTLGIVLHNIPLGFTLSSTFEKLYGRSKTLLYMIIIGSASIFGSLFLYKFKTVLLNDFILGSLLSFTFGMILYIAFFEFMPLLKETKEKKTRNIALVTGVLLMLFTLFL